MILHRSEGVPAAVDEAAADEAAGPAPTRLPIRRVPAMMMLAAARRLPNVRITPFRVMARCSC